MRKHWQYFKYVVRHKWFVFLASWETGVPLLGLLHDNSKFRPSEWRPYAHYFYGRSAARNQAQERRDSTGYYKPVDTGDAAFDFAWLLHQKRNKHHWQNWIRVSPSIHLCYTASVWQNEDRHRSLKNSAASAVSFVLAQISSMAARCATFVVSTTRSTTGATISNTSTPDASGTATGTTATARPIGIGNESGQSNSGEPFLSTTEEARLAVRAATNRYTSFWRSTMLKVEERSTDDRTASSPDSTPTDGQSRTTFRPSSASSVTIAIQRLASMEPVPTWRLGLIPNDNGSVKCMLCGENVLPNDNGSLKVLEMPEKYRREALADWYGAGKAQATKEKPHRGWVHVQEWWDANNHRMELTPDTRAWFGQQVAWRAQAQKDYERVRMLVP